MKLSHLAPLTGALLASAVLLVAPQVASAAPSPKPIVMVVGGIDSTFNDAGTWGPFGDALPNNLDWAVFSYAGLGTYSYTDAQTCQSLATSEALLKQEVDDLRPGHSSVILVGHSLGGVLAFDVGTRPDEVDFVKKVVTIDAPLGGVHSWERMVGQDVLNAGCPVLSELRNRQLDTTWQSQLAGKASTALSRGQQLMIVTNQQDSAVDAAEQGINGVVVNFVWSVVDSGANHSAVLHDLASVQQIAQFVSA